MNVKQDPLSKLTGNSQLRAVLVVIIVGIAIYFASLPHIEKHLGIRLPGLAWVESTERPDKESENDRKSTDARNKADESEDSLFTETDDRGDSSGGGKQGKKSAAKDKTPSTKTESGSVKGADPTSSKTSSSNDRVKNKSGNTKAGSGTNAAKGGASGNGGDAGKDGAALGVLTDIGGGVLESTAGLLYKRGSEEGHRTKHVMKHSKDEPTRDVHGVFEGDESTIFAVIDEAYLLIKQGSSQAKQIESGDRQVYEINLKRRIGFVGGRNGKRQNNPSANYVRLVLEDNEVITAFPVRK
jgi:hypothetical protein